MAETIEELHHKPDTNLLETATSLEYNLSLSGAKTEENSPFSQ